MEQQQYYNIMEAIRGIDNKYDEKLDKILIQTTKTNGRVNGHDMDIKKISTDVEVLKTVRSETKGRDRTVWVVLVCIATLAGFLFQYYLSTKK